jgi:TusA-related sulfurtransferase
MKTVDCRGLPHPQPLELARKAVAEQPDKLEVLVDSPEAVKEIARFFAAQGYAAQSVLDGEQVYHIRAGRPGFKQADGDAAIPAGQPEDLGQRPRTFLILTSEMLGEENGGLGRGILESFLATLPGRRGLWRLALLNGAVKLATEPGPALGMLQKLADQGIGLLVHDASLAHFGLAHALQAGRSSGMGEIASSAEEADKVVRL